MTVFLTWLGTLLEGLLAPLIEKWIANMQVQKTVSSNQAQLNALIKSVAQLQTAKSPEDYEAAIKALATADNSNSQ